MGMKEMERSPSEESQQRPAWERKTDAKTCEEKERKHLEEDSERRKSKYVQIGI